MSLQSKFFILLTGCMFIMCSSTVYAQDDSIRDNKLNLLYKVMDAFKKDSTEIDHEKEFKRNDQHFEKYEGLIIRDIVIKRLSFGINSADTTQMRTSTFIDLANQVHHLTKTKVIQRNLLFKEGDPIRPFLLADNARFLRQLPYLQDADIIVKKVSSHSDSADILVVVKDVFSLGGAIGSL
ncbi:MAG: hypothetical protein ABIN48_14465 [Ginsengibacter sp.]